VATPQRSCAAAMIEQVEQKPAPTLQARLKTRLPPIWGRLFTAICQRPGAGCGS